MRELGSGRMPSRRPEAKAAADLEEAGKIVATRVEETGTAAVTRAEQNIIELLNLSVAPLAAEAVESAHGELEALAAARRTSIIERYSLGAGLCAAIDDNEVREAGALIEKKLEEYRSGNDSALDSLRALDMYVAAIILDRHVAGGIPENAQHLKELASLKPEDVLETEKHLGPILGAELGLPIVQLEQKKEWLAQVAAQYGEGLMSEAVAKMGERLAEAARMKRGVVGGEGEARREAYEQFLDALSDAEKIFTAAASFNSQMERAESVGRRIAELDEHAKSILRDAENPQNSGIRGDLVASAGITLGQVSLLEASRALIYEAGEELRVAIAGAEEFELGAGRARRLVSYSEFLEGQADQNASPGKELVAAAREISGEPGAIFLESEKYETVRLLHSTMLAAEMQISSAHEALREIESSRSLSQAHKQELGDWVAGEIRGLEKELELLRKGNAPERDLETEAGLLGEGNVPGGTVEMARQKTWALMMRVESAEGLIYGLEEAGVEEFSRSLQERGARPARTRMWDSLGETAEKSPEEQEKFLEDSIARAIQLRKEANALAEREFAETGELSEERASRAILLQDASAAILTGLEEYARAHKTLEDAKKNFRGNGLSPWEDRALSPEERKKKDGQAKLAHIEEVRKAVAQIENGILRASGAEGAAPSINEVLSAQASIERAEGKLEILRELQSISILEHRVRGFAPGKQYTRTLWDAAQKARKALEGSGEWEGKSFTARIKAAQDYTIVANGYANQFLTSTWRNCRMRADGSTRSTVALPEIEREVKERVGRSVIPSELARRHTGRALRAMVEGNAEVNIDGELKKGRRYTSQALNGYDAIAQAGMGAAAEHQRLLGMAGGEEIERGGAAGSAKPPEQVAAEEMEAAGVDAASRRYEGAVWAYGAGEISREEFSASRRNFETVLASAVASQEGRMLLAEAMREGSRISENISALDLQETQQDLAILRAEDQLTQLYSGEVSFSRRQEIKKTAGPELKERIQQLESQIALSKAAKEQIVLRRKGLQSEQMRLGTALGQGEVAAKIEKRWELQAESRRIQERIGAKETEIYGAEDLIRELEAEIASLELLQDPVIGNLASSAQSKKARLKSEMKRLERLREERLAIRQEHSENERDVASLPENFEYRNVADAEHVKVALGNVRSENNSVESERPNLELAGRYGEYVLGFMENYQTARSTGIGMVLRGRDVHSDTRNKTERAMIDGYLRAAHLAVFGGEPFRGSETVASRHKEYAPPMGSAEQRRAQAIPEARKAHGEMQGALSLYAARVSPEKYEEYRNIPDALASSDRALIERAPVPPRAGASEAEWAGYHADLKNYEERCERAGMIPGLVLSAGTSFASASTGIGGRNALASQVAGAREWMLGTFDNWEGLSATQIASNTHKIDVKTHTILRINDMQGYGEMGMLGIELLTPIGWAVIVGKLAGGALEQMALEQKGEVPWRTVGEIALMESGKLAYVTRFGGAIGSLSWARGAIPRAATAGERARIALSAGKDVAFGMAQISTVTYFTGMAYMGATHGISEYQETGFGLPHVLSQTVFTLLPLKGPVLRWWGEARAKRISAAYQKRSVEQFEARAAREAKVTRAFLDMERSVEANRAKTSLVERSKARAREKIAERLGLERPKVIVDLERSRAPQPAPGKAVEAVEAERFDAYFHGKKAVVEGGKIRYEYMLQEGVVPKTFTEMQVREMEQAIFYAEKIARGEVVEIPRSIRKMAERLSVEGEFVRAVEVLDAVSGSGGGRDARALAHYVKSSKEAQFRLVVEAFESERMSGSYRLEMEAAAKRSSALAEVESVLKEHSGEKKAIEIEYGSWRNELEAGDTVRVRIPAQKGMRLENVRIEKIAPAQYGRQMIITYTVESTGSTGMVAVRPGARGVEAHNTIAANVLNNVRAFEVPTLPAAAPIPQAAQAREFGEFWVGVEQGRAVAGERFRVADAQGKMVEATLSRVHVTPKSTILQFTVEGKSFAATLGRGESAARAEAIVRSKVLAAPAPAVAAPAPALAAPVQQAAPPQVAQPRDFGEFWGRISRGKAKLGEKFTLADVQGKKIEATLDAINVTPAGTTTITITAGQRTFALTSKVGMNVVGQAEAEASIRNILKPAAPKQAAERAQSRKERQEAQFMDRHSTEWVEKTISETLPKIGETSAEQGRRLLAYRRAAMEAPEARKAILEKVLKRVPPEAREGILMEWRLYVDITIPGADGGKILSGLESFSSIPVNEKSPKITADIDAFLAKAVEANAHGITAATGGHERITDIIIRGELHKGAYSGPLKRAAGMDRSTSSAFHGPFWVVLESGEGISGARFSDHHIAYVFPTRQHREMSARAVKEAYSKGIITRAEAVDALTKMVSAKEAGKSPKGMFSNFAERNVEVQRAWNERALVAEGELASFERFGMGRSGARASEGKAPGSLERLENYSGENVAMPLGDRILVYDGAYLLGKHGTGTESAGSKLGNVETPGQLADIVRRHVNAETLARTEGITRLANIDAKKVTGTDSLVEITFIREGGKRVNAGTELKEGVNYDATVRDANGVEHRAIVRYEVVREGSPDGRIPPIRQAVAYTLAEPPPTTKLNIVIGRIDLADPRAGWVNEGALRRRLGDRAVDGAEGVYSIFTIFPGRYTPAADARNGASVDALVGMTGLEFWNGRPASAGRAGVNRHALMRKPTGEIAERLVRREADTSEAGGGRSGTQANAERASVPAYDNKALSREFKENGIDARAMGILQKTSLAELNAALGKAGFNAGEVAKIIDLAGRHRIAGAQAKAKTPAQQGQKAKKSEKPAEDAKQAQKSEDANARLLRAEEAVGKMPKAERDSLEAKLRPHIGALRPMFQRADFKGAEVEAYLLKNGFSKAEANSAINLLLSATNRVTDYSSMAQALEGYSTLFELGQSLSPLMGKVRKAGIVPGRGPGIHVGDLINPRSPEYSLRAVESLNKPLPIRTKGKSSKKLISGQDVDVSIAGFRESAQRVYGPEILEMGSRIRNEKIFKEYFKLETVSEREMYLDRVTKSANWMEGISSRSLREYIRNQGREGLESVLQFSDAMRSAERLKARVESGDTTLKIEDAIRVVENIQTVIERGFSDFQLTAMSNDGSTRYLIRVTPSGLSHLVEGHFGDASNPQQAAALIRRAIGGQPTGRVESSSPVAGRVQETMTFGEFRALVGENAPIAFSRLKTMDGGYSILATRIDSSYAAPITLNPDGTTTVRLQFITAFETTGVYSNEFTRTVLHPGGE